MVADRHQVLGGELAILVQRIAVAVDLQRRPQRQVAATQAHPRAVHRNVLLAQAVAVEHLLQQRQRRRLVGIDGGAAAVFQRIAQLLVAPLELRRSDQLHRLRGGFIDIALGVEGTQHVDQAVAATQRCRCRQGAIPGALCNGGHRQFKRRQRRDPVGVAAAVDTDFQALDEGGVVAAHVELDRTHDAPLVEGHHARRRHRQFRLAHRGVFGGPDRATFRQADHELATHGGLARLIDGHADPAIRLQRLRAGTRGRSLGHRLVVAARAQAEQQFSLGIALGAITPDRRRLGGGRGGLGGSGQAQQQRLVQRGTWQAGRTTGGRVMRAHRRASCWRAAARVAALSSLRTRRRCCTAGLSWLRSASNTALARRRPSAWL